MAYGEYELSHDEAIILKNGNVYHGNTNGELILTNQNLVHISTTGIFKKTSVKQQYPIGGIKIFNDKAQVLLGTGGSVKIFFEDGQRSFRFFNNEALFSQKKAEKEAERWVDAINQLLAGEEVNTIKSASSATVATEIIADAVSAFKNAFGLKTEKATESVVVEKVVRKCSSCGATISGRKNQISRCAYCNTEQQL